MDTMAPGSNGIENVASAQRAAGNLTYEQGVVKGHEGLDSLPGYVLVIFEKRAKGGAIFSRLVRPGEVFPAGFRIPFLDWSSQKYSSVAVNNSVLNYSFEQSVTLDDGSDELALKFDLEYVVADPQKVAEGWEHDPLRKLRDEIARVITRNCAKRKAEMFRSRFRELERIVIDTESGRLRAYAATLGLKIISIDLNKPPLPDYQREVIQKEKKRPWEKRSHEIEQDIDRTKQKASREWDHERDKDDLEHKYDLQDLDMARRIGLIEKAEKVHRFEQGQKLREAHTDAIGEAVRNVGREINTPTALLEGFEVATQINQRGQGDSRALPPVSDVLELGSGANSLSDLLGQRIREIDRWNCTFAQKQAFRSAILHIVAEALLDDRSDEMVLKQYTNKLSELGRGVQPPLSRSQRLFLEGFQNIDELKDKLR
jgi:hypothetical protein